MADIGIIRRAPAALASIALLLLVVIPAPPAASTQESENEASLELLSQPVSRGPNDRFNLRVRITNTGAEPLEGYGLVVGVHNRIQTRSALHTSYELSGSEPANSLPVLELPNRSLEPGESVGFRIEDPVASLVLLGPGAEGGVYPLKITLQDALGVTLDTITSQLLFYEEPQEMRLTVVPVLPLHDFPARGPDGVFHPDDDGDYPLEEAVAEEGWLTTVVDVLEEETAPALPPGRRRGRRSPPAPLRIGVVPSARLVEELVDMADGYRRAEDDEIARVPAEHPVAQSAAALLDRLSDILDSDGVQLIVAPYSFADLPSLAASEGSIGRQMSEAAVVLRTGLGQDVNPSWVFAPGGRIDSASLEELPLGGAGLRTFFSPDSVEPPSNPDLSGCPVAALSQACPVMVRSGASGSLTGYAFDPELQRHLVDLASGDDPRLAMQRFFAETAMIREESPGLERVVNATLPSSWRPSRAELRTFFRNAARAPWLSSITPSAGLSLLEERYEQTLLSEAPEVRSQPSSTYFTAIARASELVDHFVSIDPPEAMAERLRRNILVALSRAWWDDRTADGLQYATAARDEAEAEFEKIGAVGAAETTLTSREGAIQFVVFNDTGYEVQIRVRLDARGDLEVAEPVRDLEIADNQQTVSYAVTARASGIFPITVRLETPDGLEIQDAQTITVRSTEFNQIALGLTLGALAFLVLFYAVRGARRRRGRGNVTPEVEPN